RQRTFREVRRHNKTILGRCGISFPADYSRLFTMAREGALWMGDLADYMDENFIIAAFRALGEENVQNVKVMKNRYTGHPAGYCFVNFSSDQAALTAMHKLNGKVIPHSQP
ncbi:hypothetical protein OTU49_013764, partial [Cherax quadricarinatus]